MGMDISDGLPAVLDISWGDRVFEQRLDYLHVLFRCHSCHLTGHLWNYFPILLGGGRYLGSNVVDLQQDRSSTNSLNTLVISEGE